MVVFDGNPTLSKPRTGGDVQLTLKNLEYTIEQYLMANGTRLDLQTRLLLAGVRDCVGQVAATQH